jgi:hypothetical protein
VASLGALIAKMLPASRPPMKEPKTKLSEFDVRRDFPIVGSVAVLSHGRGER